MGFIEKLETGFFGFWVRKYKVTLLLVLLILIGGSYAIVKTPKENIPVINIPSVTVTTQYDGVGASDMDEDITEKIEDELDDVDGITKMTSTSKEGMSTITLELDNTYDIDELIGEIEDAVDAVSLPSEAEEPEVKQREFNNTSAFRLILYTKDGSFDFDELLLKAETLKNNTEGKVGIQEVSINTNTNYDIRVIISKEKIDNLGLTIDSVSASIQNNNQDKPIGSYKIDNKSYDFKFSGKIVEINDLLDIPVNKGDSLIKVGDIAEIELYYGDDFITRFGRTQDIDYNFISLTYFKDTGANIFEVAPKAKILIESELEKLEYEGISYIYSDDEAEDIIADYGDLVQSAAITIVLVFLTLVFFVGFNKSLIATTLLPIAFFMAFIAVYYGGYTFNFMSNFAFILAFGIAIDTIIIIVEGATEKINEGYNPKSATLLAVKEYKGPLIAGTTTTLAAFIPILTLPGMMGVMLAFIPTIVFITLLSTLWVSLTIAPTLFIFLSKKGKTYEIDEEKEARMSAEEKKFLDKERTGKILIKGNKISRTKKIHKWYQNLYERFLDIILSKWYYRLISTILPIGILAFCVITFAPKLGFEIFPSSPKDNISFTLDAPEGTEVDEMSDEIDTIENYLSNLVEVTYYTLEIKEDKISGAIYFTTSDERMASGLMNNSEVQKSITDYLNKELNKKGYTVGVRAKRIGGGLPVGINLITSNNDDFEKLITIADDFKSYLADVEGVSEASISVDSSLGQINFTIDEEKAALLGTDSRTVMNLISNSVRGKTVGTYKGINDDHDIIVLVDELIDNVSPSEIENIVININGQDVKASSLINYEIKTTAPNITRENGFIVVKVEGDVIDGKYTKNAQQLLIEFAEIYEFPTGMSFVAGGENEDNAALIESVMSGVVIAVFLIFSVLVFQFNSYAQPIIILYSVLMSLIGVIIGLYLTGNPLSMPAGIGFISLMGIVVNDAIVLIDKINNNKKKGMKLKKAIISGGKSRLNPILVTTITTSLGVLPVALQDPMWAGLGYTIAFGLTVGSFMTLFAIPTLYYSVSSKKEKIA